MFLSQLFKATRVVSKRVPARCLTTTTPLVKPCDPLRILFCGSDQFSIASLRALNSERLEKPSTGIESIEVVCRPGKRIGRGLKETSYPPIRAIAQDLQLKLHEIDTFTGWEPPKGINLIIAVSFGLLVPRRILGSARYGGLNVHPSMLPDLRGAAPLQHTLLQRRSHTGTSLQTLHPSKFDHGTILSQTPLPGIPIPLQAVPGDLFKLVTPPGAELLIEGIRKRVFLEPLQPIELTEKEISKLTGGKGIAHAPKITNEDRRIDWENNTFSNAEILLRSRVIGPLWDNTTWDGATKTGVQKRIIYEKWSKKPETPHKMLITIDGRRSVDLTASENQSDLLDNRPRLIVWKKSSNDIGDIYTDSFTIASGRKGEGSTELAKAIHKSL